MNIKVLIVDDEQLARNLIRSLLSSVPDLDVVAEAADGKTALEAINHQQPDLMFLDIQMPGLSGFDVLKHIDPKIMPHVIFVTAYDQYAIQAFEARAIDYILKPFDKERFYHSVARVRELLKQQELARLTDQILQLARTHTNEIITEIEQQRHETTSALDQIIVRERKRVFAIKARDIVWLEAANQYVKIHTLKGQHLLSQGLHILEKKIDPHCFFRIHRSAVVNIKFIKEVQLLKNGCHAILLTTGEQLTLSRNRRNLLNDILKFCS
ncbi:response regulator [candidate division KSB1 bacterium]|nr:response regulator [candidate division KSB1 bacterium]